MSAPTIAPAHGTGHPAPSRKRRARRRFAATVALSVGLAAALPAAALAQVVGWSASDDRTPTDAIVVLGAAQYQGTPSPVLANRLDHALTLVDAGVSQTVITVGGFRRGDVTSEAQTGKEELVAEGLRRRQVIALPFGANTQESLEAVAAVARSQGIESVTIVTDPAHAARSRALSRGLGLDTHVSTTSEGPGSDLTARYVTRESAGLITVWLDR